MPKDVFVDKHKQSDIVKYCKKFFKKIGEFKPYIVKFEENSIMKPKVYPSDCIVGGDNWRTIIVIIYNKYTFFTKDGVWRAWTWKRDTFLQLKGQR